MNQPILTLILLLSAKRSPPNRRSIFELALTEPVSTHPGRFCTFKQEEFYEQRRKSNSLVQN